MQQVLVNTFEYSLLYYFYKLVKKYCEKKKN